MELCFGRGHETVMQLGLPVPRKLADMRSGRSEDSSEAPADTAGL